MPLSLASDLRSALPLASKEWRDTVLKSHYHLLLSRSNSNWPGDITLHKEARELSINGICQLPLNNTDISHSKLNKFVLADRLSCLTSMETESMNSASFTLSPETIQLTIDLIKSFGILELVKAYFSSDKIHYQICGLDAFSCQPSIDLSLVDSSGFWHRDSTGSQIKVFIGIDTYGDGIQTDYVLGSHLTQPITEQWEMIRAQKISNPGQLIQFTDHFSSIHSSSIHRFNLKANEFCIFDTNGIHRGIYLKESPPNHLNRRIIVSACFCSIDNHMLFNYLNGQKDSFPLI